MRKSERIYREDIYGGQGKPIHKASKEELEADLQERVTENGTAYSEGYNPYLNENVITLLKKTWRIYYLLVYNISGFPPFSHVDYIPSRRKWIKRDRIQVMYIIRYPLER